MKAGQKHAMSAPARTIDVAKLSAMAKMAYAEKNMDAVMDLSSRLLEADPENFVALRLTARVHAQRGEVDLAEPIWRSLLTSARDKLEPALHLARIAYSRGDWEEMARFADLALRENSESGDALRLAITARTRAKRPDELPDLLLRIYEVEPDRFTTLVKALSSPELAQAQACVLLSLGARAGGALDALTRECRKSWELGAVRAHSRKDDEVQASYLRAIWTFDPSSRDAIDGLNALSQERLRFLRRAIDKDDDVVALQQAEAVASFNPVALEAWFAIARLSATDNPERSAECFRTCAELKPTDAYYRFRQGVALLKSDRPAAAVMAFRASLARTTEVSDPIAMAAEAQIMKLKRTVFDRAVAAARHGLLDDARTAYAAATGSLNSGGGGPPISAHAVFWAYVSVAQINIFLRSIAAGAGVTWKRAKRRYARVKQRVFDQAGNSVAGRIARGGARR
jgi:tetratricopeptide (TPR) repeat protein